MTRPALLAPIGDLTRPGAHQISPTFRRAAQLLLAHRWRLITALAALHGLIVTDLPIDTPRFALLGGALLRGHLGAVYADSWNQSGPVQLVLSFVLFEAGRTAAGTAALHVAGNVAVVALTRWGCLALRRQVGLERSPLVELAVGGGCLVWLLPGRIWLGHPAEFAIPIMWLAAGVAARRQRAAATGLLLGLAMGWEPWAVLAVPLAFALSDWGLRLRAGAVTFAATALLYGPFIASGRFRMLHHVWPVKAPISTLHFLFPSIHDVPWQLRCAQAALSLLACAGAVLALRPSPALVWIAPAAAMVTRFVLDPYILDYYWSAVSVLSFAGVALLTRRTSLLQAVPLAALVYLPMCVYGPPLRYVALCLLVVGVLVAVERAAARDERRPARA